MVAVAHSIAQVKHSIAQVAAAHSIAQVKHVLEVLTLLRGKEATRFTTAAAGGMEAGRCGRVGPGWFQQCHLTCRPAR